jgi:hypothetical protein
MSSDLAISPAQCPIKETKLESDKVYDGIIHKGTIEKKLKADEFNCPSCKGNKSFYCPDATNGKVYLSCCDPVCARETSRVTSLKRRKEIELLNKH